MSKTPHRISLTTSSLIDAALLTISMGIAYAIRFGLLKHYAIRTSVIQYMLFAASVSPVFVFLYCLLGVYGFRSTNNTVKTIGRITVANTIGVMFLTDAMFFFWFVDFSRLLLILFWLFANLLTSLKAIMMDHHLGTQHINGINQLQVLLVGSGPVATTFANRVTNDYPPAHRIIGSVGAGPVNETTPCLGSYRDISRIIDKSHPEHIVIALEPEEYSQLDEILPSCSSSGIKVMMLPAYHQYLSNNAHIDPVADLPLITVNSTLLDNIGYAFIKRAMDFVGSAVLIVLTSPIMLVAAIGTKLSSPGPIIFKQTRVGRGRQTFEMYKFRSMRLNAESDSAWSVKDDPRRTKFGSFIRHYSIDELPQLFNVLKGDMSLVGPRPEIPKFVNDFKMSIPLYMVRHLVRPGITGWAQINGYRGDTSIEKRIEHDLFYIEHWSILFDIRILLETPFKGIVAKGETLKK